MCREMYDHRIEDISQWHGYLVPDCRHGHESRVLTTRTGASPQHEGIVLICGPDRMSGNSRMLC